MKFFAIVCGLYVITATSAKADWVDVIGTNGTYTVVGFGQEIFVGIDIVVLKDTAGVCLAVLTATELDTSVSSAAVDTITLIPGQSYQLTVYSAQLDSMPEPNVRTDWRNLEIGITTADTTFIVWREGKFILPTYICDNVWGHYYFPKRKD